MCHVVLHQSGARRSGCSTRDCTPHHHHPRRNLAKPTHCYPSGSHAVFLVAGSCSWISRVSALPRHTRLHIPITTTTRARAHRHPPCDTRLIASKLTSLTTSRDFVLSSVAFVRLLCVDVNIAEVLDYLHPCSADREPPWNAVFSPYRAM